MGYYDIAQVCPNGHVITSIASDRSNRKSFCPICGAETIDKCQYCGKNIKGASRSSPGEPIIVPGPRYRRPAFCEYCGHPFPWTERRLEAARDLAQELEELSEEDREILSRSLDDLVVDTSQTAVAATRAKKVLAGVGPQVVAAFREILVDVLSETARKTLWPS